MCNYVVLALRFTAVTLKGGGHAKHLFFLISLLNSTRYVVLVGQKKKFLDVVFMVKNAVESGVRPALLISSGCGQIWAERYVTSLKERISSIEPLKPSAK